MAINGISVPLISYFGYLVFSTFGFNFFYRVSWVKDLHKLDVPLF